MVIITIELYAHILVMMLNLMICATCIAIWLRAYTFGKVGKQLVRSFIYDNAIIGLFMLTLLWRRFYVMSMRNWDVVGDTSSAAAAYLLGSTLFVFCLCFNNLWRATRTVRISKVEKDHVGDDVGEVVNGE